MKRNTFILTGLFIALLVIAFLVLQKPGEQSASSASSGLMFKIDSLAVDMVEIKTPAFSLVLEKRGVDWLSRLHHEGAAHHGAHEANKMEEQRPRMTTEKKKRSRT